MFNVATARASDRDSTLLSHSQRWGALLVQLRGPRALNTSRPKFHVLVIQCDIYEDITLLKPANTFNSVCFLVQAPSAVLLKLRVSARGDALAAPPHRSSSSWAKVQGGTRNPSGFEKRDPLEIHPSPPIGPPAASLGVRRRRHAFYSPPRLDSSPRLTGPHAPRRRAASATGFFLL